MNQTLLTKAIDRAVKIKFDAVDKLVKEFIEPLGKVGNPEELINKPYENWTPEDFMLLSKIYGQEDNSPLANLIFKKEYEKVKELESEELSDGR